MSDNQWHIIGAGSIGCLWAANFFLGGISPILIVRHQRFQQTGSRQLLQFTSLTKEALSWPVKIASPETLQQPITRLLVCTKAQDAFTAISSAAHRLADDAHIVLLQNGMGSQQFIASQFSKHQIWAGSTTVGAWMKGPFNVCHAGAGQTWLGPLTGIITEASKEKLEQSLQDLPFAVQWADNVEHKLWEKLAVNCAINGLTALYDCQNGALLNSPEHKKRLDRLIDEVVLVKNHLNIPGNTAPHSLHDTVYEVCRKTARNFSSTCMDARLNRQTELGYINAYLLYEAENLNLSLPENQKLLSDLSEAGVMW